jgi:hypothetical protein
MGRPIHFDAGRVSALVPVRSCRKGGLLRMTVMSTTRHDRGGAVDGAPAGLDAPPAGGGDAGSPGLADRTQWLMHDVRRALATPSRNPRMAVVIGRLLAVAFLLCFGTGLFSHLLQEPLAGMTFATRPVWLYQVSQGIHITAGILCFPLLFAKLYIVYPSLFQSPPVTSFANLLERASIALFVAASLVEITIGLLNTYQWYPFPFPFRQTHFALSFVIIGSLAIHIGVKLDLITRYWTRRSTAVAPALVPTNGTDDAATNRAIDARSSRFANEVTGGLWNRLG